MLAVRRSLAPVASIRARYLGAAGDRRRGSSGGAVLFCTECVVYLVQLPQSKRFCRVPTVCSRRQFLFVFGIFLRQRKQYVHTLGTSL